MTDWTAELCADLGVHARYRGFSGEMVQVARETQVAVLRAMGLGVGSEVEARAHLLELRQTEAERPLPAEIILMAGKQHRLAPARAAEWVLEAEGSGAILAQGGADDGDLMLPALPLGIHRLRLRYPGRSFTTWVLARPETATRLEDLARPARIWGGMAALYGLTDGDRAEIGSYDLLGDYAAEMAAHGADFLGINPVHAMGDRRPDDLVSPYSPSHRGFLNTWHCAAGMAGPARTGNRVDYEAALQANTGALAAGYAAFAQLPPEAPDNQAFAAFVKRGGAQLQRFALFEAIAAEQGPDWRHWPAPYRNHEPEVLDRFAARHHDAIRRTIWAQWQAERQLSGAQAKAKGAGMRLGLYLDLAVGPRLGGAETWAKDTALVTGATLGAPPDPLGPLGQSWGLAPLSPRLCRAQGYASFARLLRGVMRHAGMIRIDHILGLMRSFWIPEGGTEGTYVSAPFEALLAVVAIESHRSATLVVGEDLGLVPEGLRDRLAASGIYGLDVLQYMRAADGDICAPDKTRALALCAFATHDTPTVNGFFAAEDAATRHRLGSLDDAALAETRADRARARQSFPKGDPVEQVHRLLAKANSDMVAIQLDDLAGCVAQQNLPGTTDSYPNWQFKTPFRLTEIAGSGAFARLAAEMRAQNRSNPRGMEKDYDLQNCSDDPV